MTDDKRGVTFSIFVDYFLGSKVGKLVPKERKKFVITYNFKNILKINVQ